MGIVDLFSKREKAAPDVFQYENLPQTLRVQIVHVLNDLYGDRLLRNSKTDEAFQILHDALSREYGVFELCKRGYSEPYGTTVMNFLRIAPTERALDVVEFGLRFGGAVGTAWDFVEYSKPKLKPEEAIEEINHRFREHGVGYQFENGSIVRVNSQLPHAQAVTPALYLLSAPEYCGPNEEFLRAHEHHRHGRSAEAINDALKALESTLKVVCQKRGWEFSERDTAKPLLDTVFKEGLLPDYLRGEFTALRAALENGVPTIRNRTSGHGQGTQPRKIPDHLAAFALHLTAAAVLFVVSAEQALP